ncbi:MAG: ferredoxin reductase family protein [Desulfurivibrionaceae bacterium]
MSKLSGFIIITLYGLLIIAPLIIAPAVMPSYEKIYTFETAKGLAMMSFMILMLQPVLAGRFSWIERPFGQDIVLRFHKYMAVFATVMLLFHPPGIATGHHGWSLLYSVEVDWPIWFGRSALVVLLTSMLFSLGMITKRLTFERWRLVHDIINPLLLVLIFIHSFFMGNDLQARQMQMLWYIMIAGAVSVFLYHRLLRPRLLRRHDYTVTDVIEEADGVHTLKLAPGGNRPIFSYRPGQFHFITLHREKDLPEEEHHFTISSSPTRGNHISSTIKSLGDFTATIGRTRKGDTATVHGPFGRFSYTFHPEDRDLVFIAGGIGITPLMSMLRYMNDTKDRVPVTLFYANKDEQSIVFRKELEEIAAGRSANLTLIHVLQNPGENWQGETGHLDREMIKKYCGADLGGKTFYLCGPPGLVKAMLSTLLAMDIKYQRIRTEIFSFID